MGVGVGVAAAVGVGVGVGVAVGVGVGVDVGVGEALGIEAVGVPVGSDRGAEVGITSPLSQTIFFPDLIAVYFFPRQIIVCPTFFGSSDGPAAANADPPMSEVRMPVMPASICLREIIRSKYSINQEL